MWWISHHVCVILTVILIYCGYCNSLQFNIQNEVNDNRLQGNVVSDSQDQHIQEVWQNNKNDADLPADNNVLAYTDSPQMKGEDIETDTRTKGTKLNKLRHVRQASQTNGYPSLYPQVPSSTPYNPYQQSAPQQQPQWNPHIYNYSQPHSPYPGYKANNHSNPSYTGQNLYNATNRPYNTYQGPYNQNQGPYPQNPGPYNQHPGPYNPNQGPYYQNQGPYNPNQGPYNPNQGSFNPNQGSFNPNQGTFNPNQRPFNQNQGTFYNMSKTNNPTNRPFNQGSNYPDYKPLNPNQGSNNPYQRPSNSSHGYFNPGYGPYNPSAGLYPYGHRPNNSASNSFYGQHTYQNTTNYPPNPYRPQSIVPNNPGYHGFGQSNNSYPGYQPYNNSSYPNSPYGNKHNVGSLDLTTPQSSNNYYPGQIWPSSNNTYQYPNTQGTKPSSQYPYGQNFNSNSFQQNSNPYSQNTNLSYPQHPYSNNMTGRNW